MADFNWYCYVRNGCRVFTVLFRNRIETVYIYTSLTGVIQIDKNWTSYFFLLNALKMVNCPSNFNFVRIIPVNLCERSRSKFCANRPSRIVSGGFQHLPRDLANDNEWQSHVWSLLLYKFQENTPKIEKMFAHFYSSALPPFSYARTPFINIFDSGRGQAFFSHDDWRLSTRFVLWPGECINIFQKQVYNSTWIALL